MRVAVTGAAGRLGRELTGLAWDPDTCVPWTRDDADLSSEDATRALFCRDRPDVVIHAAAATDLVRCERDKQYAWDNVVLPALHVARACVERNARMVQVSTDYVFSGSEPVHPIPPETRPDPLNYYAFCKVAAEMVARCVPNHLVVRATMKERGPWKHAAAPDDMWISHSFYDEVAAYLHGVARSSRVGVVHFGVRDVNVYEWARESQPAVRRIQRSDVETLALPGDVRLRRSP